MLTYDALAGRPFLPAEGIRLCLTFHPPRKGRHDADNLVARMKAALDGVALALGIDDSKFQLGAITVAPPIKGGEVVVTIGEDV